MTNNRLIFGITHSITLLCVGIAGFAIGQATSWTDKMNSSNMKKLER